jgi:hypothetical protein
MVSFSNDLFKEERQAALVEALLAVTKVGTLRWWERCDDEVEVILHPAPTLRVSLGLRRVVDPILHDHVSFTLNVFREDAFSVKEREREDIFERDADPAGPLKQLFEAAMAGKREDLEWEDPLMNLLERMLEREEPEGGKWEW